MIKIRPIHANEIQSAKYIILKVAYGIYGWEGTLEESVQHFEESGELKDVDNYQQVYVDNRGIFLAVLDDNKLIGTGAIKKLEGNIAELKRLWLLEEYHGQKIGYRVFSHLLDFARAHEYKKIRLQTGQEQERALRFYTRLGFHEIPNYRDNKDNISMELSLAS